MEAYNRAVSLRRLSFAALCSEEDLLRSVLPEIQEKIADVLRLGVGQASSEVDAAREQNLARGAWILMIFRFFCCCESWPTSSRMKCQAPCGL